MAVVCAVLSASGLKLRARSPLRQRTLQRSSRTEHGQSAGAGEHRSHDFGGRRPPKQEGGNAVAALSEASSLSQPAPLLRRHAAVRTATEAEWAANVQRSMPDVRD